MENKQDTNRTYLIIIGVILFIILAFVLPSVNNELVRRSIVKSEYKGIILEIFNDIKYHNVTTFKIRTFQNQKEEKEADSYPDCWKYAEVGDSIIKEKDVSYITIKKKNGDDKIFYYKP